MKNLNTTDIQKLEAIIASNNVFTITAHTNPDGDAVGSTMALCNYLINKGKDVMVIYPDEVSENINFIINNSCKNNVLIYTNNKAEAQARIDKTQVLFFLDANSFKRASNLEEPLYKCKALKVLIDHHINPDTQSFNLCFSETLISSASELLYHILMQLPDIKQNAKNLPINSANALMCGMTTDTNNFSNSVYPSTFKMASALLEAGVDRDNILFNLFNHGDEQRVRAMGEYLKNLLTITGEGVAYAVLSKDMQNYYKLKKGDTEGFVNIPLSIKNVVISIFLKEDDNYYRVSIRSKKGYSANALAIKYFNGGGHENAAGGRLFMGQEITETIDPQTYIETVTKLFLK